MAAALKKAIQMGVTIMRGWVHMETHHISRSNVADVQVMSPVLRRPFGVGHVRIFTSDGNSRTMRNVKANRDVAKMVGLR